MLYNEYAKKIAKLARIKAQILKYKYVIISILALIVGFTIFYNSSKGKISGDISINDMVYGQSFSVEGLDALMSNISYEFSYDGGKTWVSEKPYLPGDYLVRGVSNKTFNRHKYSKSYPFTIDKKEATIDILSQTLAYGDSIKYDVKLANDDYISYIDFIFDDISSNETKVIANLDTIKVLNRQGNDVTNGYCFLCEKKDIQFETKRVNVMPASINMIYDGIGISNVNIDDSFISYHDTFNYEIDICKKGDIVNSAIKAGAYETKIKSLNVYHGGIDVSNKYEFNFIPSIINIEKRKITIKTASNKKMYDSLPLSDYGYIITNGSLADGDRIIINKNSSNTSTITNAGSIYNVLDYDIVNINNESVKDCYEIEDDFGLLEITPKEITVTTGSTSLVYNGNTQQFPNFFADYLDKSNFKIVGYPTIKNYGEYENRLVVEIINDGIINSKNYTIKYNYGQIIVQKREVFISANEIINKTYSLYKSYSINDTTVNYSNLIDGHEVLLQSNSVSDAGVYNLDINAFIYDGYIDVSDNYIITSNKLHIEINKLTVKVDAKDFTHIYDGQRAVYDESSYSMPDEKVYDDVKLNISVSLDEAIDAGDYFYRINGCSFVSGNPSNYIIELSKNDHKLTILKRTIEIAPLKHDDYEYNKKTLNYSDSLNNFTILNGSFVGQDCARIKVIYVDENNRTISPINVGMYHIKLSSYDIINGKLSNYELYQNTDVFFNIKPRIITISPINKTYTYGQSITYDKEEYVDIYNLLIDDLDIKIDVIYNDLDGYMMNPKNAGLYEIKINNVYGLNDNYAYKALPAVLTINKLNINVSLNTKYINSNNRDYHIYDGNELIYDNNYNNYDLEQELPYGDILSLNVGFMIENVAVSAIDANVYQLYIMSYSIYNNPSNNYEISYQRISFEIKKKEISVFFDNQDTIIYDGLEHQAIIYLSDDLANGEELISDIYYNNSLNLPRNYGTYNVVASINTRSLYLCKNYIFDYSNATTTLNISKKEISIELINQKKEYDKNKFILDDLNSFRIKNTSMPNNEILSINCSIYDEKGNQVDSAIDFGLYYIVYNDFMIINGIHDNYIVNCINDATLNITKMTIDIMPKYKEFTYGEEIVFDSLDYIVSKGILYDELQVEFEYEINKNAGEHQISISNYVIANRDNYIVNCIPATFRINKFYVSISLNDNYVSHVYDNSIYKYNQIAGNYRTNKILPYNEKLILNVVFDGNIYENITTAKDADSYTTKLLGYTLANGMESDNYEIAFIEQSFIIRPCNLKISPKDNLSKKYDGYQFIYPDEKNNYIMLDGSLVGDDEFKIYVNFYQENNLIPRPVEVGEYDVLCSSIEFVSGKKENYIIDFSTQSTLIISKTIITVRPKIDFLPSNNIFDGSDKLYDEVVGNYDLINSFDVDVTNISKFYIKVYFVDDKGNEFDSIKDAGTYRVCFKNAYFTDYGATKYNVVGDDSYITYRILEKNILISANDIYHTYDGLLPDECINGYYASSNDLENDDKIRIFISTEQDNPINVGRYQIIIDSFEFEIGNESNYILDYDYVGMIIIQQRNVVVRLDDDIREYNKKEYVFDKSYECVFGTSFVGNDSINLDIYFTDLQGNNVRPINVGLYYVYTKKATEMNFGNINNYIIEYFPGMIEITKFEADVIVDYNFNKVYDDKNIIFDSSKVLYDVIMPDDTVKLLFSVEYYKDGLLVSNPINAGSYTALLKVSDVTGDLFSNYMFNVINEIEFVIEKRALGLSLNKDYNDFIYGEGSHVFNNDFIITTDNGIGKINEFIDVYIKFVNETTNVDAYSAINAGSYSIRFDNDYYIDGIYQNENYSINFDCDKTFTIYKKKINVSAMKQLDVTFNASIYQYDNKIKYDLLPYGEMLSVKKVSYYTDVDFTKKVSEPILAGLYYILIDDVKLEKGSNYTASLDNYDIKYIKDINNTLRINKLYGSLLPVINDDHYFNYLPKNTPELIIDSENEDLIRDIISVVYQFMIGQNEVNEIKDVGNYKLMIREIIYSNEEYRNSLELERLEGSFNVIPKDIVIRPGDCTTTYNGLEYIFDSSNYLIFDLMEESNIELSNGDTLSIQVRFINDNGDYVRPVNVGIYKIEIASVSLDNIKNYNVIYSKVLGTLEILKQEVSLEIINNHKEYDGIAYTKDEIKYIAHGQLYDNIKFNIMFNYDDTLYDSIINAGIYKLELVNYVINNNVYDNTNSNYMINVINDNYEIEKRIINIKTSSNEFMYDGNKHKSPDYKIIEGSLVGSDELRIINVKEAVDANTYVNTLVVGAYNSDVFVDNYQFIYEYGTIVITPRIVTITSASGQYFYGDDINASNEFESSGLVDGHLIKAISNIDFDMVGEIDNIQEYQIYDDSKRIMNDNYIITPHYGKIIINKRIIECQIGNMTNEFSNTDYVFTYKNLLSYNSKDEKFISLIEFIYNVNGKNVDIHDVGDYLIDITYAGISGKDEKIEVVLYDELGREANTFLWKITKKLLTIASKSETKLYDGKELKNLGYEESGLNVGNMINILSYTVITNPGIIDNVLVYSVTDLNGNDVSFNYEMNLSYGKLKITNSIRINVFEDCFVYNGKYFEINEASSVIDKDANRIVNSLICHIVDINYPGINAYVIDAGIYDFEIVDYYLTYDGVIVDKEFYDIEISTNPLEIIQKDLNIEIKDFDGVYNGLEQTSNEFNQIGLIEGHRIEVVTTGHITKPGLVKNDLEICQIFDENGIDVTMNYDIKATPGEIFIDYKPIYFKTGSASGVYNGKALINNEFEYIEGLIDGHVIDYSSAKTWQRLVYVGSMLNYLSIKIYDENGKDVSRYYSFEDDYYGELEIFEKEITIRLKDVNKEYDGTPLTSTQIYECLDLINGDSIDLSSIKCDGQQIEVGQSTNNIIELVIRNSSKIDVTSNYMIKFEPGILTVY